MRASLVLAVTWLAVSFSHVVGLAKVPARNGSISIQASTDPEATVLSFQPFIKTIEHFLTAEEAEHLIALAKALPNYDESKGTNTLYFDRRRGQYSDPLLGEIEIKIAALLGWPDHPHQESLCVHRIAAAPDAVERVVNVHHDKANKPWTAATVIIYLEDVEDGGETIWPCLSSPQLQQACRSAYEKGARWYNGERTVMEGEVHWAGEDHSGQVSSVDDQLSFLKQSTSDLCSKRNESYFKDNVLSVKPRRGTAALFYHDKPGGGNDGWLSGDELSWHTGCKVYKGVKWTVQKFAEIPQQFRKTPSSASMSREAR